MVLSNAMQRALAIVLVRLILGLIFVQAGIFKLFMLGPIEHAKKYFLVEPYLSSFVPNWMLWLSGVIIPFIELLGGALLVIGFKRREALIALGGLLVVITFGHLLADPLFSLHQHVFPRLAMVVFLLVMGSEEDRYSFDALHKRRKRPSQH